MELKTTLTEASNYVPVTHKYGGIVVVGGVSVFYFKRNTTTTKFNGNYLDWQWRQVSVVLRISQV